MNRPFRIMEVKLIPEALVERLTTGTTSPIRRACVKRKTFPKQFPLCNIASMIPDAQESAECLPSHCASMASTKRSYPFS